LLRVAQNIARVLRNPKILVAYTRWVAAKAMRQRGPIRLTPEGLRFDSWVNFSEYLWHAVVVPPEERNLLRVFFQRAVGRQKIAVDVGGNIGQFTLTMAELGFEVHSFEPIPGTYNRLAANVALNGALAPKIHLNKCGLAGKAGTVRFAVNRFSPAKSKIVARDTASNATIEELPVDTLDAYCERNAIDRVAFLKVDVEGFELEVLKGATRLLSERRVDAVYLEVIPEAFTNAGTNLRELFDLLASFEFHPHTAPGGAPGRRLTVDEISDQHAPYRNVLWMCGQMSAETSRLC
jgi:FkbM family methyltransferase